MGGDQDFHPSDVLKRKKSTSQERGLDLKTKFGGKAGKSFLLNTVCSSDLE